ncbi:MULTISPECIES: hypothetical protein [unclassified Mesorhizobium]|nr:MULTISPECIES: hypothetical protein [unclassified Mesorhizobium]
MQIGARTSAVGAAVVAAAFLIGVCAMWISDIVFEVVVRRFRQTPDS